MVAFFEDREPRPSKTARRVVQTIAGPHTCSGPGDVLIDEYGCRWRVVGDHTSDGTAATAIAPRIYDGKWIR